MSFVRCAIKSEWCDKDETRTMKQYHGGIGMFEHKTAVCGNNFFFIARR